MSSQQSTKFEIVSGKEAQSDEILLDIEYDKYKLETEQRAEIYLYTRSITNNRTRNRYILHGIFPYIYIDATEEKLNHLLDRHSNLNKWYQYHERITKTLYYGGNTKTLLKIFGSQPWLIPQIRSIFDMQDINHYESDIPFTHRFMIDFNLKGLEKLNFDDNNIQSSSNAEFDPCICSFDIEINFGDDEPAAFAEMISIADRRITAIGVTWNSDNGRKTKSFILRKNNDTQEVKMIKKFTDYLWNTIDPDVIVTYNGDKFDWPYIVKRMEVLDIDTILLAPYQDKKPVAPAYGNGWRIPGVLNFDLYNRTKWLYTKDGKKTLDSVAEELLGVRKIEIEISHGKLWRRSLNNYEELSRFTEYVERDAEITHQLWNAMNMDEWIEVIKLSGAPPGEAINFTERQSGEFRVYQIMFQEGTIIPKAPTPEERKKRRKHRKSAKGGLVLEPEVDIATSVLIADFASMYPSIILAHNVGGESFKRMTLPPTDRFESEPMTSMAKMQKEMLSKRSIVKDELKSFEGSEEIRQQLNSYSKALKLVSNSTFGSYNYIGSRFYDYNIASTITQIGRNYLRDLTEKAAAFGPGYQAIYGDTDSVFIEMPVNKQVQQLWEQEPSEAINYKNTVPEVDRLLEYLTEKLPEEMLLEFHDIAYRILFHEGAKKRYAYVSAIDKSIHIYGFEAIRHDWSPFAKDIQKKAFDLILRTGNLQESKKQIIQYIQSKLKTDDIGELLTTYGAIKKNPSEYSVQTPAIGAFLNYMHRTGQDPTAEWKEIEYFPFIITRGDGPQKDRARHPSLVKSEDIDIDHYINEALRTINRFNLAVTLDEVKGIEYLNLMEYFDKLDLVSDVD